MISQALHLGFDHFSIIGKESLLSPEITFGIFEELELHRSQFPSRYELITNGTMLANYVSELRAFPNIDFLSVSIDGLQQEHDRVRGEGNFDRALKGLEAVARAGIKKLTVINTAMPHNVGSLGELANFVADKGAKYLSVGLCFPTGTNDPSLTAGTDVLYQAIEQLRNAPKGLDITIGLLAEEHPLIFAQLCRDGFYKRGIAVTEDLAPMVITQVNDSPRTAVQTIILPTVYYAGFRIDCTGAAMNYCKDLRDAETRGGFGNIRDSSIAELYAKARILWPAENLRHFEKISESF